MSPLASDRPTAIYVGIGVGIYDDSEVFSPLPGAVSEVRDVATVLATHGYQVSVIPDPTKAALLAGPDALDAKLPPTSLSAGGSLVILWSGHGEPTPEHKFHLISRDTSSGSTPVVTAETLAGMAARTGAGQILLILDTCYSGSGVIQGLDVADRVLRELPSRDKQVWFGVVASAMDLDRAREGVFAGRLLKLLRDGPDDPVLQLRWSAYSARVRGDDLIDALLKEWDVPDQIPKVASVGSAWLMFRNPRHNPDAPEGVVEHLLLAARGVEPGEEGRYFTGRAAQLDKIVAWLSIGKPGVFVVTGPAGSGKSAIVGRVVSLSNPEERELLLAQGPLEHLDPGLGSVHAHVHTRGLTAAQVVEAIDGQLVRGDVLPPNPAGPRNWGELHGAIQRAIERGQTRPLIAIDGLDEAHSEAWRIASDVIRVLADVSMVLVSTRELPSPDGGLSLVQTMGASEVVDLAQDALQQGTEADVRRYVAKRLYGGAGSAAMDIAKVGDAVVRLAREQREGLFLLARVITAQLRIAPIDTSQPAWESWLDRSVGAAFDRDLSRVRPLHRGERELPQAARELLAALAWSYGSGLPDDVWPIVAAALSPSETPYERSDVFWLLGEAWRYVVQGGMAGRTVYRLAHQKLAEQLRRSTEEPLNQVTAETPAVKIARALVHYYLELLVAGHPPQVPTYLWRFAWRHCADAGDPGIGLLRTLVEQDREAFLPDLAMALNNLGIRYSEDGRRREAVAPTEEAVSIRRKLAAENPAFLPDLAGSLNNLGNHYSEVGHRQEAVAPTEEAVTIRRKLAAENRAILPDLAGSLNNLGNHYSEVGRPQEAVSPTEEAVNTYRNLTAENRAFLPDLAMALNNLGIRYSEDGRRREAVAPTEEAVTIYRNLTAENRAFLPNLAMALNNLGVRYSEVGHLQEAVSPTEEAVTIYRNLTAENRAFVPDLAGSLNNLGIRYSEVGRLQEAVAPTEEAVTIRRKLAAENRAFLPNLAGSLSNLGLCYGKVGRLQEAVAPTEEAVTIYRKLAAEDPTFLPDLAASLNNLGAHYSEVGRLQEAVAPAEEAVTIYRKLAAENRAFLPNLAASLNNLGAHFSEVGRWQEAVAPTEEAVTIYRKLAAENRAFLPNLAGSLSNLGSHYSEVGREGEIDSQWTSALAALGNPEDRAFLLLQRAEARDFVDASAVGDLLAAQALLRSSRRGPLGNLHRVCRALRAHDAHAFDVAWQSQSGSVPPPWLLLSESHLALVGEWLDARPVSAAKQHIAQHQEELLAQATDIALDEIALIIGDPSIVHGFREVLGRVRQVGIDEAYLPLLASELLSNWMAAGIDVKQALLAERRGELVGTDVAGILRTLREADPENSSLIVHEAILTLARLGRSDIAFDTIKEPRHAADLLTELTRSGDVASLLAMSTLVLNLDLPDTELATAWFHKAVALALGNEMEQAHRAAQHARGLDPQQVPSWLALLVELAPHHEAVLPLSHALIAPASSAPGGS